MKLVNFVTNSIQFIKIIVDTELCLFYDCNAWKIAEIYSRFQAIADPARVFCTCNT